MMQSNISRVLIEFFDIIYRLMQGVLIAAIIGALGNALYAFIQSGWSGLSKPESWFIVVLIRSYPITSSIITVCLLFLYFAGWIVHQQKLTPTDPSIIMLRRVKKFRLAEFPIGEKTPYLSRQGDKIDYGAESAIKTCLVHSRNGVVFIGHVESGKTRLAFESIQAILPRWFAVVWFSSQPDIPKEVLLRCRGREVVLFLDDLQDFAEQHKGNLVRDAVGRLRGLCKCLLVIATMRIEDENVVRREMGPFLQEMREVNVPDVSEDEKQEIIRQLKKRDVTTYPYDFDGTFGSLVQGLEKRKQMYRQMTSTQKILLKSIRLLDAGYVFPFLETRIQIICQELFGMILSESEWRADVAGLCAHGFVCPQSTPIGTELRIQLKPEVFRRVIFDFPEPGREASDDLRRVREIFLKMSEPDDEGVQAIETALSADEREREVQQLAHDERMILEDGVDKAGIQQKLGAAFLQLVRGDRADNVEQSINKLKKALTIFSRESFSNEWGETNRLLANAYHERIKGERLTNLEKAIAYCEAALQVISSNTLPEQWAIIQHDLGDTYFERMMGGRRANLEQAIKFFNTALQVYTPDTFPEQWAMTQNNLGQAYTVRIEGERRTNVELAIACHLAASRVYSRDTFPERWAMTQNNLGNAYQYRINGERRNNLEQTIAYYKSSLQVYTREKFPNEWAKIQNNLGAAYCDRIVGERRDNLEEAIQCSLAALEVHTQEDFPEYWAMTQLNLGNAYLDRIAGERRDNLERAITSYEATLQVYKREAFPEAWAKTQNVRAKAYGQRMTGERQENLKRTIDYCQSALQVYTREAFPEGWAKTLNTLGNAYTEYFVGNRRENVEQAVQCCQSALQVYTREAFPEEWAKTLNGLGRAYRYRIAGEQQANLEQAIFYLENALQILTRNAFPTTWALIQRNLGEIYQNRIVGDRSDNLKRAVTCCQNALGIYTCDAFPSEHHQTQLFLIYAEAAQQNWPGVHNAYKGLRAAEELLVRLGAGAMGRDFILKEGRDAAISDGFALIRMGQVADAAVAIEQGRARGLAEALALDAADPARISDAVRRTRYEAARQQFIATKAALNETFSRDLPATERRRITQERSDAYHKAVEVFDAVIAEVRAAQDPPDFLNDTLDAATILHAAVGGGAGHALVYLAATPWGGIAIAALSAHPPLHTSTYFAELDLPNLTETVVGSLIEQKLDDNTQSVIGGFGYAQMGNILDLLEHQRASETFRSRAMALHITCTAKGKRSMLERAAQRVLNTPELAHLAEQPLGSLKPADKALLANTLGHLFLQFELQHCLKMLAETALSPLITWLLQQGATSLTLIPCGYLATFPLAAVPLADGRTVGETLPTSVALSARSLLYNEAADRQRTGLYALGDPRPTHLKLRWSEAEAHTLAKLARNLRWQGEAKVHKRAVRSWLVKALQTGRIVDASCHGSFDSTDFLQSALQLAGGERLTLANVLNREVDLRGLRLLILSASQTAILDLRGANNEARSLAAGMIQAGARAVLASLWLADDKAKYLLMVRFAQEWLPRMDNEPPAGALARAQHWLRTATNRDLQQWLATNFPEPTVEEWSEAGSEQSELCPWEQETPTQVGARQLVAILGQGHGYETGEAETIVHITAKQEDDPEACPYTDPIYWAGFQITGW